MQTKVKNWQVLPVRAEHLVGWCLGGIILLASALRLYHIDFQSLWYDELHSVVPTGPNSTFESIINYSRTDQPPLFFIYLHYAFVWFGYDSMTARVAAAVIGILGVPAVYWLGYEVSQKKEIGLMAAFLVATNYFCIYYSQEVRFYSMCFLLSTLSYCFYLRSYRTQNPTDFVGYIVTTVGLLYTHYYGIILYATQALTFIILLRGKPGKRFIFISVLSGLLIFILFWPWIPTVLQDAGISSFWIKSPSPFFFFEYFYDYTGKDAITSLVLISLLIIYLRYRNISISKLYYPSREILGWWIVFSYAIPYVRSITSTPILHPRYTIVTLPALLVLSAVGWAILSSTVWKRVSLVLLLVGIIVNFSFFKQPYTRITKDQFREASQFVRERNNNLPIYSTFSWHYNFYFRDSVNKVQPLSINNLQADSFWLLQGQLSEEDAQAEINKLTVNYQIVDSGTFFGTKALLFKRL